MRVCLSWLAQAAGGPLRTDHFLPPVERNAMLRTAFATAMALALASQAIAKDAWYHVPLWELKITEGELPAAQDAIGQNWQRQRLWPAMAGHVMLDIPGEAY